MPTYQYQCKACKHEFDELQSITAPPLKTCPQCKKKKLQRLIGTGAGLLFKGSGFYITDYRSESYKAAAKAESGDSGKSDGKASKSESTSASKGKSSGGKDGKVGGSGSKGKSD